MISGGNPAALTVVAHRIHLSLRQTRLRIRTGVSGGNAAEPGGYTRQSTVVMSGDGCTRNHARATMGRQVGPASTLRPGSAQRHASRSDDRTRLRHHGERTGLAATPRRVSGRPTVDRSSSRRRWRPRNGPWRRRGPQEGWDTARTPSDGERPHPFVSPGRVRPPLDPTGEKGGEMRVFGG